MRILALGGLVAGAAAAVAIVAPGEQTGPSSSQSPYLLRSQPGIVTKSILTVGDSVNTKLDGVSPYRMVGIPDGPIHKGSLEVLKGEDLVQTLHTWNARPGRCPTRTPLPRASTGCAPPICRRWAAF